MSSHEHNEDRTEQVVSTLLSTARKAPVPPDEAFLERLSGETVKAFIAASAQRPKRFRGYRIMQRKTLKWLVPVAAAAAVVVAVGLWPERGGNGRPGGSGRVYALSDVPALMDGARTLHVRMLYYPPTWVPPEQEREIWAQDCWVDQPNLSWCWRETYVGKRPGVASSDTEEQHASIERMCDGQYVMVVNHGEKSVSYEKPTPFKLRYQVRHERDNATPLTAELLESCTYSGEELLDGQTHQIWEHVVPPYGDGRSFKSRLWFSPQRGEVSRVVTWAQSPYTNGQWVEAMVWERFERDVTPPPGTFSTEPPSGYRLTNTKETADPDTLDTCSEFGRAGNRITYGHVTYEFPGRVLLFAVSSIEKGKEAASQENLFKDLVPGGPLPKLPMEIHTLRPTTRMGTLAWLGFHLVHTHKNGRYYEWTLYVPNQTAPRGGIPSYEGEYRVHTEGPAEPDPEFRVSWGAGNPLHIRNIADFDEFVLGAMAELSDGGNAPEGITYDYVMQLSQQIHQSLQNEPAAAPADDGSPTPAPPKPR
jgi:hypothetical protein